MYVYVCFDVEDLVHADADDIVYDIAGMLAEDGVRASLFVVGEKARLWERRGRWDVIGAAARHDVGLHTDRHSVHPTVSEYLAGHGWADGVAEALRREGPGAADLARLFGEYPSSWATSGASWAPQIPAATRRMGIPANVYSHARLGQGDACWYAGQLCYADTAVIDGGEDTYCDDEAFAAALPRLLEQVSAAQARGAACLGLFGAHPTRLRYTVFWDVLNFAAGQNTAPADYRSAPRRTDAAYATALRNLRRTVAAVRDLPDVTLVSPRDLNRKFATGDGPLPWATLSGLAAALLDGLDVGGAPVSPAQALDVLSRAILGLAKEGKRPAHLSLRNVLGPAEQPVALARPVVLEPVVLLDACAALAAHVDRTGQLPSAVHAGDVTLGPGTLARACSGAFLALERGEALADVRLAPGAELPACAAQFAQEAIYALLPHWPPHRPDLRLDLLAEQTALQTWSLAPARLG